MAAFDSTVLVVTYNRAHLLPRALDSIIAQSLPPAQIIVMDDGSTDSTFKVVSRYRNRVEYYRQPNGGKASAINAVMPRIRGDYLWIFDDDDVALPDALAFHAQVFADNPDIGWTYSSFYHGEDTSTGELKPTLAYRPPNIPPHLVFVELMLNNFTKGQSAMVARTECYRRLGPIDESLGRSEDYEFMLRMARRYRPAPVNEFTYVRREHREVRVPNSSCFKGRAAAWKFFDRRILDALLDDVTEAEFVPECKDPKRLSRSESRLFRLRRMAVAAHHELWERALADLEVFVEMFEEGGGGRLGQEELRLLRFAMTPSYGAFAELSHSHITSIRKMVSGRACGPIRREFLFALFGTMTASLRKRRLRQSLLKARRLAALTANLVWTVSANETKYRVQMDKGFGR